jgi:putative signal transducing protein
MSEGPVRVYATGDPFTGQLTKGHLEAEGITVLMKGEGDGPYRLGPVYLWVSPENEERAREIIGAIESGAYAVTDDDVLGIDDVADEQPQR